MARTDSHFAIMVLNDGETWTDVTGCSICIITEETMNALGEGDIRIQDIPVLAEIALQQF